ncbi:MAG TPA: DUF2339 domain-containing protein, partial [Thermoanaerobaculia bacterium]|nr:DUF2339 domain-containing protein [Thermoanaerobaculia bacterium]
MTPDERLDRIEERLAAIERHLGMTAPAAHVPSEPRPAPQPGSASPSPPPASSAGSDSSSAPARPKPKEPVETRIGAHWLNRAGIAALVIGAAFFLEYAFVNQWIGPAARVGIGLAAGVVLFAWSERFQRHGYVAFAHSLKVAGAGILYLSIWAASQTYALIGNASAFAGMALITASIVALSIRHQSEFLAALAFTCGFLTPVLLSTGANRQVELFSYLAVLDVAALVLAALFPWGRALAVAYVGTQLLFIGWFNAHFTPAQTRNTIAFAALFFLLFAVVPLLRRWNGTAAAGGAALLLAFLNAFVYFMQLTFILRGDALRLSRHALVLAGFHVVLMAAMRIRTGRDDLAAAQLAIAIVFVTVAIPLRLDALWVTIGWLVEAGALLALAPRVPGAAARVFRLLGTIALVFGVFRLLFLDRFEPARFLFNERTASYALAIALFAGMAWRTARSGRQGLWKFSLFAANALALIVLTAEVSDYFTKWGGSQFAASRLARDFSW